MKAKSFIKVGVPKGEQASEEFNVYTYAKNYPELVNFVTTIFIVFESLLFSFIPVYSDLGEIERYNIFRARMLIRCDENEKLYLYDIVQIKKETSTPLK